MRYFVLALLAVASTSLAADILGFDDSGSRLQ